MRAVVLAVGIALACAGAAWSAPADPADPDAALNTCLAGEEGKADQVIAACTEALTRTDLSSEGMSVLHQRRATASFEGGDFQDAIIDFSEAVRLDPKSSAALAGRGLAYYSREQYAQAIYDFTAALALNPDDLFSHSIRGVSYVKIDKYESAVEDLTAVLSSKQGGTPMDHYYRGVAYLGLGDKAKAKADFNACLKMVPDQSSCQQALSQVK